jgi:glycosyltransferase involved in cell wall biosynthesis
MRIAQVSPLYESVPPKLYGGTERVVSYLTEELVKQGHEVTLFASGDSITRARLVPCSPQSLRLDENCVDQLAHHILMLEKVFRMAGEFDLVHFHIDYLHFPLSRRHDIAHVTTLHGRLDIPDLQPLYREFPEMPVISISNFQRKPLPWINWQGTIYHGLPEDLHTFSEQPGRYLAYVGRISPEKRVDRAILIAKRVGMPLVIAAKVDRADKEYFEEVIRPLLDHPLVEYIGEVNEQDKGELLRGAYALLFPIDWPEPFGLAMIEAMACGTPVIAFRCGSVPEVVDEGVTGYICDDIEDAVRAVERAGSLDRRQIRRRFEERFSASRMARDYVRVYEKLVAQHTEQRPLAMQAHPPAPAPVAGVVWHSGDGPAATSANRIVRLPTPGDPTHTMFADRA